MTTNQHEGACAAKERAISTPAQRLIDRLENDRFGDEYADRFAAGWNACADNAIAHVERYLCERADQQPVMAGLRELRDAECIDLSLKHALIRDL